MERKRESGEDEDGQAREGRARISVECEVRQGVRPWKLTRLEDISPSGFRIAWFPNCRPELPLRIRIPGLELLSAHVRWQKDYSVGCELTTPLHVAVFEHIVTRAMRG